MTLKCGKSVALTHIDFIGPFFLNFTTISGSFHFASEKAFFVLFKFAKAILVKHQKMQSVPGVAELESMKS